MLAVTRPKLVWLWHQRPKETLPHRGHSWRRSNSVTCWTCSLRWFAFHFPERHEINLNFFSKAATCMLRTAEAVTRVPRGMLVLGTNQQRTQYTCSKQKYSGLPNAPNMIFQFTGRLDDMHHAHASNTKMQQGT